MSFTLDSSLDSMSRLGRTSGLLERNRLANGNTLFGRVLSFLNDSKQTGGLLTILGHPSVGKTTEFNRLARELSSNKKFYEEFFPLYTELQNAEIADSDYDEDFIWKGIVSGSIDVQLHDEEASKSLEAFCNHCKNVNRRPLLMIDTLDILMLHQVGDDDINIAKLWANFLQSVIENKVILVWTCRPFEWKYFQREIDEKYSERIDIEELPLLQKDQLKPFNELSSLDIGNKESTEDSGEKAIWPEQEAWQSWSINFQSHMPIFADRWSKSTKSSMRLDEVLFAKFANDFRKYTRQEISGRHWYDFVKELPSQYLYSWIWEKVSKRMNSVYSINSTLVEDLREVLENEAKNTALNYSKNSSRVRLEYNKISTAMKTDCKIDEVTVNDFFNVCESRGLLSRNGNWVDFSHQLLFEEAVLNSEFDDDEKENLQKFPSILLRTKKDVRRFSKSEQILRNEVLNAIGNWTGFMLSYHPQCISSKSNLDATWGKWVDYSHENVHIAVPDVEINEHTEKRIALQKYQQSAGVKSLIVNGAPGTGKTYFCRDYLRWVLGRNRSSNAPLKWRYYTLNNHLAEHFDDLVNEYSETDPEMRSNLEKSRGGSFAIDRLLTYINPTIDRHKSITEKSGIGLLTFSVFKVLIREYFNQKRVKHSGVKCPPLADAWILYNEVIHDPVSGCRITDLDKKKFNELNTQSFKMSSKMVEWFIKFHHEILAEYWWTYSYAASDCRHRLENMTENRRRQYQIDVLIVDEVQDINPPVMALLLELMCPNYDSHSIMIAGDMVQTVNRSGFHWIRFSEMTAQSLKESLHPDKMRLIQFGVLDENELEKNRTTLKYVWRNGKRLVEFNNKMRQQYASNFGISDQYSKLFDYPGGDLLISEASLTKDLDSEITVIESYSVEDYNELIGELSRVSSDLVGEDIAVIAPFDIENEWNDIFKLPVYDAESVKGLEFEGIVVLMPYLIPENEARSSLIRNLGDSNDEIESQIQKWCDAWKENRGDASQVNFENFNQLFLNVMTRMNVLFSRPEKRILILNPVKFGESVQIFDRLDNEEKMMSFGIPKVPKDVQVNSRGKLSMLDTLRVPLSKSSTISQSYKKLLSKALNQAKLNDDGTQIDNERKVWDNLWHNLEDDKNAPLSAIAYAGGLKYKENIDISRLLRSDLGRNFGKLEGKSVSDKENQIFDAIRKSKIDEESGILTLPADIAHYIFSNLSDLLKTVMRGSHDFEKLHEFMMNRLFGIDITKIENYDFSSFLESNMSTELMSLEEFSEGIDVGNNALYTINQNTKKPRESILYHLASRMISSDVIIDLGQPNWVDESQSLWDSIMHYVDQKKFDSDIVKNSDNSNLVDWMEIEFKKDRKRAKISPHSNRPAKTTASNRSDWKKAISKNETSPMHLAAWRILNKVIPGLHSSRAEFSPSSEFYLSVYDALNLSIDVDGMRILHEVLEYSISQKGDQPEESFPIRYESVVKKYSPLLEKGKSNFNSNMMRSLEDQWLLRDVDRTTHRFKSSRGASVIGAMVHISYMLSENKKSKIIGGGGGPPFIGFIERQVNRFFNTSGKGLHNNLSEYWLKYNLQDETFRELFAKILTVNIDDIQLKTEGNVEQYLVNLLLTDLVSMTDRNWDSPYRRDPGISGFIPDFSGSKVDSLTQSIVNLSEQLTDSRGIRFFRLYIENLDKFLDLEQLDKDYNEATKKKGNEGLNPTVYRRKYPNKYMHRDIWIAWEWLLYLIKDSSLLNLWSGMHSDNSREQRDLRRSRRGMLHPYLRMNHDDSYSGIQEQIYKSQYLSISKGLVSAKTRGAISFEMYNVLDMVEGNLNKSNTAISWKNMQRIILNHALVENGYSNYFIDWDICLHLLNRLPDWPDYLSDMNEMLGYAKETLATKWASHRSSYVESKGITLNEMLKGEWGSMSTEHIGKFVSKLENIHTLVEDTLKVKPSGPTQISKRMKNTYLNSDKRYQKQRDIIAQSFVEYIMFEVGFIKTSKFRNTKNSTAATDRVYIFQED
ncbi:MAG: hypothetical protein CMB32_00005 [Euryarchaeota archaeon]|nr:hypothetical protein [Euryarchaeota archaeon]